MTTRPETLDNRRRAILAATVRAHIETGAPVPSSLVTRRCGRRVSSATVRHEMSSLEEAGFLQQPHTSAGRLPTAKAFRFYAEEIAARASLRPADQRWIRRKLPLGQANATAAELAARVPHVLAELCRGVGLLLAPPLAATVLDQVRFVLLDDGRVLAVVVTSAGAVRDKVVRPRESFRPDELARMSAYLNQHFRGWTLEAIRAELARLVEAERSEFLRRALRLCQEGFDLSGEHGALHLEGLAHLVEQVEAADPQALRGLLRAIEEKERLAHLLNACIEAPEPPLRVLVGLERLSPAMKDFVLISAPYGSGERPAGSLGLLGRTRMNYDRAVTAVAYVASLFDRDLAEN